MNERIRNMWADALESGEFKQTKGVMKRQKEDKCCFCCLGVLCELYQRETHKGEWDEYSHSMGDGSRGFSFNGYMSMLPPGVLDWAGLGESNPVIDERATIVTHAVTANDNQGWSFEQIAEAIRNNL